MPDAESQSFVLAIAALYRTDSVWVPDLVGSIHVTAAQMAIVASRAEPTCPDRLTARLTLKRAVAQFLASRSQSLKPLGSIVAPRCDTRHSPLIDSAPT